MQSFGKQQRRKLSQAVLHVLQYHILTYRNLQNVTQVNIICKTESLKYKPTPEQTNKKTQ